MAPIVIGIAGQLGVSADPFLIAVSIGASCDFLTPFGHQNNTLIMGPGGYVFGDFWRMGLPLDFIIVAVSRSEEHTSELQSLMRISYAIFCLKKKNIVISSLTLHTNR